MKNQALFCLAFLAIAFLLNSSLSFPVHATATYPITFQTQTNYKVANSTAPLLNMTLNPNFHTVYDNFSGIGELTRDGLWKYSQYFLATNLSFLFDFSGGFANPYGIAISNITQKIYVSDSEHSAIKIFAMNGTYLSQIALAAATPNPLGLCIVGNRLYVANGNANTVRIYDVNGTYLSQISGPYGFDPGDIIYPTGIDVKGDYVYFSDEVNVIEVFHKNGTYISRIGSYGTGDGQLQAPKEISIQGNTIYIADSTNQRVAVFDINGTWLYNFNTHGTGNPYGIKAESGYLYVTDWTGNQIQIYTLLGTYVKQYSLAGTLKGIGYCNHTLYIAQMSAQKVSVFYTGFGSHFFTNGTHLLENATDSGIYVSNVAMKPYNVLIVFKDVQYIYFSANSGCKTENLFGLVNATTNALSSLLIAANWYVLFNISGNGWLSGVVHQDTVTYHRQIVHLTNQSIHSFQIDYFQNGTYLFLNDNNVTKITSSAITSYSKVYLYLQKFSTNHLYMDEIDNFTFIQSQIMQNTIVYGTPHTISVNSQTSDAYLDTTWHNTGYIVIGGNHYTYVRYKVTDIKQNSTIINCVLYLCFSTVSSSVGTVQLIAQENCSAFPNSGNNLTAYPISPLGSVTFTIPNTQMVFQWVSIDISALLRIYKYEYNYVSGNYIGFRVSSSDINPNEIIRQYGSSSPSKIIYNYYTIYQFTPYNYTQFYQTISPYFSTFQRDKLVNIIGERFNYATSSFEINVSVIMPFTLTFICPNINNNFSTLCFNGFGTNQMLRLLQYNNTYYILSDFNTLLSGNSLYNIYNLTLSHSVYNLFYPLLFVNYVINSNNTYAYINNVSFPVIQLILNGCISNQYITTQNNDVKSLFFVANNRLQFQFTSQAQNNWTKLLFTLPIPFSIQYTTIQFKALATHSAFGYVAFVTDLVQQAGKYTNDVNPISWRIGNDPTKVLVSSYRSYDDNLVSVLFEVINTIPPINQIVTGSIWDIMLIQTDESHNTISVVLQFLKSFLWVFIIPAAIVIKTRKASLFWVSSLIMTFVTYGFGLIPLWVAIPFAILFIGIIIKQSKGSEAY
jgi:DNA-binding beta-propeller fold protein YncE